MAASTGFQRLSPSVQVGSRFSPADMTNFMRVEVVYFAEARELAGRQGETLRLPSGSSTSDAVSLALKAHRGLHAILNRSRVVVNGELIRSSLPLHEGDTVALLPPSCGG